MMLKVVDNEKKSTNIHKPTNKHDQTKTKGNMNEHRYILIMKDALSINLIDVHVVTGIHN